MFVKVPGVLEEAEVRGLVARLSAEGAPFEDGRATATGPAARAKHNLQLAASADGAAEMRDVVLRGLARSERFRQVALPKIVMPPVFNRYDVGMQYGAHVDAPTTRGGEPVRLDVSVTVFLSDPTRYDGGELVIETLTGGIGIKLAAGDAVVYAASTLHRVAPVRAGTRLAAITWVRSMIRDPAQRELLCELELARASLEQKAEGARAELDLLSKTYTNLVRMWSD
jgi:PKHD-type hydroxylase